MTKDEPDNTEQTERTADRLFPLFDSGEFSKIGGRNMEVTTRTANAYINGAIKFNQEVMGFFNSRVKKDIAAAKTLMTSKSSEQAFRCQAEFVEGAIRDYAEEASKIIRLTADMAYDTLSPVEERTEEVLHSIDEQAGSAKTTAE